MKFTKREKNQYDVQEEPIVISKITMDILLKQKKPSDLIALYLFYYYTAKWQKTNTIKSTTLYTAKGLKWGEDRIRKNKKQLIDLELIEDIQDKKDGKIVGWYIRVKFIWWNKKRISSFHPQGFPHGGNSHTVENNQTNALNTHTLNALNTHISIINNTTVSKKPLTDKVDSIIYFWNNLPGCTRHSKLNKQSEETKVYKTISFQIENMLNGLPLYSNKDGSPNKKYEAFLSEYNIPSSIHTKTWAVDEIKNTLQSIADDNNSRKKLSLDVAFWNGFAKSRGGGFSLFIYAASQIDVSNEYKVLSDTFTKAINISLNAIKKKQWAWKFEQIVKNNDMSIEEMQNIVTWYAIVRGGKYIPIIDSPEELEEKYDRLIQAKERDEQNPPSATVDPSKISYSKESLNLFSYEDVEEFKRSYQSLVKFWRQAKIWNTGQIPSTGIIMEAMISIKNWINNRIDDYYGKVAYRLGKLSQVSLEYLNWLEDQDWIKNKTGSILFANSPLFKRFCSDFEGNIMDAPIRSKGWGADEDLKMLRPDEIETTIKQYKENKTQQEERKEKQELHQRKGNAWAVSIAIKYWRDWSDELITTINFTPCPSEGNEWKRNFEKKIQVIEKEHQINPTMRNRSYSFLYKKYI